MIICSYGVCPRAKDTIKIHPIRALEVFDSRGNPTVEAEIILENGLFASAMVPSGASTGEGEAAELRDGDATRFRGKGVLKAVANINERIAPELRGRDVTEQRAIDQRMIDLDGTPNKSSLGANAILAISMAAARVAALASGLPLFRYLGGANAALLPVQCLNVINGGRHAQNNVDFQEYMIAPHHAASFSKSIRMGLETFHALKDVLQSTKSSDEMAALFADWVARNQLLRIERDLGPSPRFAGRAAFARG